MALPDPLAFTATAVRSTQIVACTQATELYEPPVAVKALAAVAEDEPPALLMQIDLRAWRGRFFWRLVASVVVRRLAAENREILR